MAGRLYVLMTPYLTVATSIMGLAEEDANGGDGADGAARGRNGPSTIDSGGVITPGIIDSHSI
jgi:hypothetical protein